MYILQREVRQGRRSFWFDAEKSEDQDRIISRYRLALWENQGRKPWEAQRIRVIQTVEMPA